MLVSDFVCMVLVLMVGFWGCLVLLWGWRKAVGIRREGLDGGEMDDLLAAPAFPCKAAGICLPGKRNDSMAKNSLNVSPWLENCMCWLSRFCSMASRRNPIEVHMDTSKQNFSFPTAHESAKVRKILLVEDTEINRVLLRRMIQGLNLLLEEAENGQIAVDYFKQGKNYDLVFMDKEMPVMDGHEATRQLRSLGVKTPIVALTGNSLQSDKDMFFEAGADEFRTKPLSRAGLVQLLGRYGLNNANK